MTRALVTGAAGFIGSHVVRSLLARGHEVVALHRPSDDTRNLEGLPVHRVGGDVLDAECLRAAMEGCGWVFHLAAIFALWTRDAGHMRRVNVEGTRLVLSCARSLKVSRVVHTSSIARFGGQGLSVEATEESPFRLGPTGDAYSLSKRDAHEVAEAAARDGQDVVLVAPCGPLGPGDVGPTPTGRLLLALSEAPVMAVVPTRTCFADVRAMAEAHVLAAERGERGASYLLGQENLGMEELVARAARVLGRKIPTLALPYGAVSVFARAASALADRVTRRAPLLTPEAVAIARLGLSARCDKAQRELGMPIMSLDLALGDAFRYWAEGGYMGSSGRRARVLRRLDPPGGMRPGKRENWPNAL